MCILVGLSFLPMFLLRNGEPNWLLITLPFMAGAIALALVYPFKRFVGLRAAGIVAALLIIGMVSLLGG